MAAADVLCLPSYREGFGVVIIEAAAVGIPVIASRIYGITDAMEENVTGLLHEPRNDAELHERMSRMVDDNGMRMSMGRNARLRAQRDFSMTTVTAAVMEFYETMVH